jgi:type III restriction enzyme
VETKGKRDVDVSLKASAAKAWCESASNGSKWQYLYVPQNVFERTDADHLGELSRVCAPALQELLSEADKVQVELPLYTGDAATTEAGVEQFLPITVFRKLPPRYQKSIEQAAALYSFFEKKKGQNFAPAFQPLLGSIDEAAKGLMMRRLGDDVPSHPVELDDFFSPHLGNLPGKVKGYLNKHAMNLKKTLVYRNGLWPMGLLAFCLDFGLNGEEGLGGVFDSLKRQFGVGEDATLYKKVDQVNKFRNTYVAHTEKELSDPARAQSALKYWLEGIFEISVA